MTSTYDHPEPGLLLPFAKARAASTAWSIASDGITVTTQSGLPLRLRNGVPVQPAWSLATRLQLRLKRALIDIPLSLLALVLLSPLLLLFACLIPLTSKGPAIYRQQRVGFGGEEIDILKFRTMRLEACDPIGLHQAVADDPRVTPIGRFLRATSIDELPQLWNILRGDMAVIGPRPMVRGQQAAGADYHELVTYYDYRHLVPPGLSGWAQANGLRGPTHDREAARQRIDHDCAYVQNFSLMLDIKIILKTVAHEFLNGSGL